MGEDVVAGDVDGDGVSDLALAAPAANGPANDRPAAGEVYIVLGRPSLKGAIDLTERPPGATIYGPAALAVMPTAMALADVDGDGREDITLGVPLASSAGRTLNGLVYVVFDSGLAGPLDLGSSHLQVLSVYGSADHDELGTGLTVADLDGDGRAELIMVASHSQTAAGVLPERARIYVLDDLRE